MHYFPSELYIPSFESKSPDVGFGDSTITKKLLEELQTLGRKVGKIKKRGAEITPPLPRYGSSRQVK